MPSSITLHFFVSGQVQGVFYRRFCQIEAEKLHVTGWARNLTDGRVEVKASGDLSTLKLYEEKLWKGPPLSKVTSISSEEIPFEVFEGFSVS